MFKKLKKAAKAALSWVLTLTLILGMVPLMNTVKVNAEGSTSGLFTGKYGIGQIFDCCRNPSYPTADQSFRLYSFMNIYDAVQDASLGQFNTNHVDWGTNQDRYIQFEDSATQGQYPDHLDAYLVKLVLHEKDGTVVKTISDWGTVWALDETGFFYEGQNHYGYFISNNKAYTYGSGVTYTPTKGLVTNVDDLNGYIAATTVLTVPGAPTVVNAVAGNHQATVSFTAPTDTGSSAITQYIVTSSPGGITATGTTNSPITVTGLTNGTSYTFTVKAVNAAGTGPASSPSASVTPKVTPTIAVSSITNPISVGNPIVLNATLSNAEYPTGTVNFYNNSVLLGSTSTIMGGVATFTSSSLTSAQDLSITAEYVGDSENAGATSTPVSYSVNKGIQAALTIGGVPSTVTYGDPDFTLLPSGGSGSGNTYTYTPQTGKENVLTVDDAGLVHITGAGTATITVTKAGDENYNPIQKDVTITILQKALNVSVSPVTINCGQAISALTVNVTGFATGETESLPGFAKPTASVVDTVDTTITGTSTMNIQYDGGNATSNYTFDLTNISVPLTIEQINVTNADYEVTGIYSTSMNPVGPLGWNKSNLKVEPRNGYTFISTNKTTWVDNLTLSIEGTMQSVTFYLKKADGTVTESETIYYNLDETAPQVPTATISGSKSAETGWYTVDPTITITPAASQIDAADEITFYKLWNTSTGAAEPTDGTFLTEQPTINADGIWILKTWTEDFAGNKSTVVENTINVDMVAPANLKVSYKTNNLFKFLNTATFGLFFKETVTVALEATDTVSGVKEFTYTIDGNATTLAATDGHASFNIDPLFKGNFSVVAKDNAGNSTAGQIYENLAVDNSTPTKPTISATIGSTPYTNGWTKDDVVLNVNGAAALSGIAKYQFIATDSDSLIGNETWIDITSTNGAVTQTAATNTDPLNVTSATFTVHSTQQKYYHFRAVSNSGIEGPSASILVKIDAASPSIQVDGNTANDGQSDHVTITPTVGASNITKLEVKKDSGSFTDITSSYASGYTITANGTYTFKVTNGAGAAATKEITYEKLGTKIINAEVPGFTANLSGEKTYSKGDTAVALMVSATVNAGNVTYQWYENSTNAATGTAIAGATAASYMPKTDKTGVFYYYVVATNTNNTVNGNKTVSVTSGIYKVTINNVEILAPKVSDGTPKTTLQSETSKVEQAVLTDTDKAKLAAGSDISIYLKVVKSDVPQMDEGLVLAALDGKTMGQYLNVSLIKNIDGTETKVTETKSLIKITIAVPENMRASGRTFAIIRVHNGVTTTLADLDNDPNTITIETDRFSTYAIAYSDTSSAPVKNQNTGDHSPIVPFALLGLGSVSAMLLIRKKRRCQVISKR